MINKDTIDGAFKAVVIALACALTFLGTIAAMEWLSEANRAAIDRHAECDLWNRKAARCDYCDDEAARRPHGCQVKETK